MQLISILGSRAVLSGLLDVRGLQMSVHSARNRGGGGWIISAYANDEAIVELRRRGCVIEIVMTSDQVSAAIASGRGPIP
jgi:hypothetical protein